METLTQKELEQLINDYQDGQFGFQEFLKQLDEKNVLVEDLQQFTKYLQEETNSWNLYSNSTSNDNFVENIKYNINNKIHIIFYHIKKTVTHHNSITTQSVHHHKRKKRIGSIPYSLFLFIPIIQKRWPHRNSKAYQ